MSLGWRFGSLRHASSLVLLGILSAFSALAQTSSDSQQPAAKAQDAEVVSRDTPATFKVRVNNVLVRVVVRDTNGKVIANLKKEDFQLADNRKLQVISTFAVETPGSHVATVKMEADSGAAPSEGTPVKAAELPQRFITLFFDDLHLSTQDAPAFAASRRKTVRRHPNRRPPLYLHHFRPGTAGVHRRSRQARKRSSTHRSPAAGRPWLLGLPADDALRGVPDCGS